MLQVTVPHGLLWGVSTVILTESLRWNCMLARSWTEIRVGKVSESHDWMTNSDWGIFSSRITMAGKMRKKSYHWQLAASCKLDKTWHSPGIKERIVEYSNLKIAFAKGLVAKPCWSTLFLWQVPGPEAGNVGSEWWPTPGSYMWTQWKSMPSCEE